MRPIDADALIEVVEKSMAENPHKEKMQRAMHIHEHKYFLTLLAGIPTIQPVATDTNVGDAISRQAVIDALDVGAEFLRKVLDVVELVGAEREKYEWGLGLIEACIVDVKELPPAQPEPMEGEWVDGRCNKCGGHAPFWAMASTYYESNFCPHCGAKMKGAKHETD